MIERILAYLLSEPWLITQQLASSIQDSINTKISGSDQATTQLTEKQNTEALWRNGSVGILPIHGPIFRYSKNLSMICGDVGSATENIDSMLSELLDDPSINSIVLDINSPGGIASGIHELGERIYQARKAKKIVAYVGGIGASAGYWLASAASEIVIDKTATLGSIGTAISYQRIKSEMSPYERIEMVSSQSPKKRLGLESDEGRAEMQQQLDDITEVFVGTVARNRGVSVDCVLKDFGQGGVMLGRRALDAKLGDRFSSLNQLIKDLNKANTTFQTIGKYMDLNQLKTEHPETYQAVFNEGQAAAQATVDAAKAEGIKAEQARITGILELNKPGYEKQIAGFIKDPEMTREAAALKLWQSESEDPQTSKSRMLEQLLSQAESLDSVNVSQDAEETPKRFSSAKELQAAAQKLVAAGEAKDITAAIEQLRS